MPERGIHKQGPHTGTGKPDPDERSLPNGGRPIKPVFRDKDGKKIPPAKKDK